MRRLAVVTGISVCMSLTAAVCDLTYAQEGVITNAPPRAAMATPTNGAVFVAPTDVTVEARAADTDGRVVRVLNNGAQPEYIDLTK